MRQQVANNNHVAHGTCIICTPSVLLARSIKDWVNPLKSISSKHPPSVIRRARRGKEITSHILEVDILNSCYATTRGNCSMYKVWCGTEYFRSSHAVSLCACRAPPSVPSLLSAWPACATAQLTCLHIAAGPGSVPAWNDSPQPDSYNYRLLPINSLVCVPASCRPSSPPAS